MTLPPPRSSLFSVQFSRRGSDFSSRCEEGKGGGGGEGAGWQRPSNIWAWKESSSHKSVTQDASSGYSIWLFHFRLSAILPLSHWLFAVLTFCFWLFPFWLSVIWPLSLWLFAVLTFFFWLFFFSSFCHLTFIFLTFCGFDFFSFDLLHFWLLAFWLFVIWPFVFWLLADLTFNLLTFIHLTFCLLTYCLLTFCLLTFRSLTFCHGIADGQLQTNVGDVVTIRRVEDVVIGNKGILLEIRESKGNERSGAPGRRRILTWKKRCLRGGGSGPDRDGTTAAPADKENWQTEESVGRGEGLGPTRPYESYPGPDGRTISRRCDRGGDGWDVGGRVPAYHPQ